MDLLFTAIAVVAIFGHWSFCIFVINRIHATGLSHRLVKLIDLGWYFAMLLPPMWLGLLATGTLRLPSNIPLGSPLAIYAWVCVTLAGVSVIHRLIDRQIGEQAHLTSNHTQVIDVCKQLGHMPSGSTTTALLSSLPTNQVFDLHVQTKRLRVPRLPEQLEGMTITHLSDLHFTGRINREYFECAVEQANARVADLVVISGDIIDKRLCFSWLEQVLGKLQSRVATCFVLGNHDIRLHDEAGLRRELTSLGMLDLGTAPAVVTVRSCQVVMAGNELPWFKPVPDVANLPRGDFRIGVSHSPDQLSWARRQDMDLLLAGHTHGGQIRLPGLGPVLAPSRFGVRYSAGLFYEAPTLMHVSRGLSGTRPLRFNCAPELARLTLSQGY